MGDVGNDLVRNAMTAVVADLVRAGLEPPRVEDRDWAEDPDRCAVVLWSSSGSGVGVAVDRAATVVEQVVSVTDQVQEWVIEDQLWSRGRTNWPACPHHPTAHPLTAAVVGGAARWTCPRDGAPAYVVGGVPAD